MTLWSPSAVATLAAGFALLASSLGPAAPPRPGAAEIRERLEAVYARPEFSPQRTLAPRFLEWLAGFLGWLGGLREAEPVLFLLLLGGCIVLLLLLGWYIARAVRRMLAGGSERVDSARAREERQRLSAAHREEAQRLATAGEFTEAIRYLFLALVYRFDESGRVSFQRAYTNREYLAQFSDRPAVHHQLAVFVDTLDEHWYGQRPTEQRCYEDCLRLYGDLA
jgi:hypothetical protein